MAHALPALPADIRFDPLIDVPNALDYSFSVKKEALGPHICARWEWDETYQLDLHKKRIAEKPFFAIRLDDTLIGTVSWATCTDHIRFGEFYIFERYQGHGLGSRILAHALVQADRQKLPVRLEYLKWNPVGSLYLRYGFVPTHESEIHVFMERAVHSSQPETGLN